MVFYTSCDEEGELSTSFNFTDDAQQYEDWIYSSYCSLRYQEVRRHVRSKNPVGQWITSLRDCTEVESLSALQAKSVALNEDSFEALTIRNAQVSICSIRRDSVKIIDDLDYLIDKLPLTSDDLRVFKTEFNAICSSICSLIAVCRRRGCDSLSPGSAAAATGKGGKSSASVADLCQQMMKFIVDFGQKRNVNNAQLEATLRKLKERLGELVDLTIRRDSQVVSNGLYKRQSYLCIKWSLLALWQLTQNDAYICRIFVESQKIVKRLIKIVCGDEGNPCPNPDLQTHIQLKAAALRVLTYLCINEDAILQIFSELNAEGGLVRLLAKEREDVVLREAAGLIVQVTMPFIDYKGDKVMKRENSVTAFLRQFPVSDLVQSLTNIARHTCSRELFLLTSASLANISFLETYPFVANETCNILVAACKQRVGFANDVAIKDQIITVLANVASKYPLEIVSSGGLVYLLCALQLRTTAALHSEAEVVAIERIQQKVAAALARLGSHRSSANLIYKLNGIQRLIGLCKEAKERNFSDTVLLAALAALRRIAATVGRMPFKQLDALHLIDLDIRDSFLLYSSKGESYV